MLAICLSIALALGVPADPRPVWRDDFSPIPEQAKPRPSEAEPSPMQGRTGQIVLRNCWPRAAAEQRLASEGYHRLSDDLTNDGVVYQRWARPDGGWEGMIYDPTQQVICPFLLGPAWKQYVPSTR